MTGVENDKLPLLLRTKMSIWARGRGDRVPPGSVVLLLGIHKYGSGPCSVWLELVLSDGSFIDPAGFPEEFWEWFEEEKP
jgi:hypothetical protein